jgi:signal transduction histidine kinase
VINSALERGLLAARILVVDDIAANVEMATGLLEVGGYTDVTGVTDPEQGLAMAESGSYDLLLLDIRMPETDGAEFIRRLRARDLGEQPAIIVLTAQSDDETRRAALHVGARDFIVKPYKPWELLQRVRNALEIQVLYRKSREFNDSLEARISERTRELEAANRVKSEFLANMSHELRTPLNAIIGFSELIIKQVGGPVGDTYREYARDIFDGGYHLLKVINDILVVTTAEAGKLELVENEVDLNHVISSVVRVAGAKARDKGVEIFIRSDQEVPLLWCDETKLKQILLNLLSNATKFTSPGGRIEISAGAGPHGLYLSVGDSGIGIPASELENVLLPFVQLNGGHTRTHEGTGLGLAIVKAMVELHGGTLTLKSELGFGTTVMVTFPEGRVLARGLVAAAG